MIKVTLFFQIIEKLYASKFKKLANSHKSDKHLKGFDSWSHFLSILFSQFAKSQSVRDISSRLRSRTGNLNYLGMLKAPSKSTIRYQNKNRS